MAEADYRLMTEATGQRIAEALEAIPLDNTIADAYSSSVNYAVGDYCIYNNTLYKCNTAISTAEAWTPAHWTATSITEEFIPKTDVVNNLNSTNTDKPLSAAQGKALNDKIAWTKTSESNGIGIDHAISYPNTAKEIIVNVAWLDSLSYAYTINIADVGMSSFYTVGADNMSVVIRNDATARKIYVNSLMYNGQQQNTALFKLCYR